MLTLNETKHKNASKRVGNSREEKKKKGHKRRKYGSEQKLRNSLDIVANKIERQEEETSLEMSYLEKNSITSNELKMEMSASNENEYIIISPLESIKSTKLKKKPLKQCMNKISKSQFSSKHYNTRMRLRKHPHNNLSIEEMGDNSCNSPSFEDGCIPNVENVMYENSVEEQQNQKNRKDMIKWSKKLHPLSLYYTERRKPYLKCPACGAMSFSSSTYQRHLYSHMKMVKNYVCNFCHYSNAEPGMLFAHLIKHQNQCESCNENLLRKNNFEKHRYECSLAFTLKRDQHGSFICTICKLAFDLSAQLEKHWFKHTCEKQKWYQCSKCSGLYEKMETLKNHKCLKCPVCGEIYENLHRLKAHTICMKHYLKCPICSYQFILLVDHEKHLALHRKVHQPMKNFIHCLQAADGKTYQCNLCDMIFYTLSTLRSHLMDEHGVESRKTVQGIKTEECIKTEESIKTEEVNMEDNYELKEDIINMIPDFKEFISYPDSYSDINSLQQNTHLEDTL